MFRKPLLFLAIVAAQANAGTIVIDSTSSPQ